MLHTLYTMILVTGRVSFDFIVFGIKQQPSFNMLALVRAC